MARMNYFFNVLTSKSTIGGVMVSVLASSAVNRGFQPRSGQTKYYKIDMCCFSSMHAVLRRKSGLFLQWTSTIKSC